MFSSLGLFKHVVCPEGNRCQLLNCIFSHTGLDEAEGRAPGRIDPPIYVDKPEVVQSEPPRKKPRVQERDGNASGRSSRTSASIETPSSASTEATLVKGLTRSKSTIVRTSPSLPSLFQKDVSPPSSHRDSPTPKNGIVKENTGGTLLNRDVGTPQKDVKIEPLQPRTIPKPPAQYAVRHKLLGMLHEQLVRLNNLVKTSNVESKNALEMSLQELITAALDEEEQTARSQPAVYSNIIRLRIVALRKKGLDEWVEERRKIVATKLQGSGSKRQKAQPIIVSTGLSPKEELELLAHLVTPQKGLDKHGYVTVPPSETDIEQARQGVEAAKGWEHCDRCHSRFQVFPGRREEDGALTSGGSCTYHWGKPRAPPRGKDGKASGKAAEQYLCCRKDVGSPGCTTSATHVFKISDPKRLALVMPFVETPRGADGESERDESEDETSTHHVRRKKVTSAVCFDCEMGYTSLGTELIRLTATAWPSGEELIDVLVRPVGEILDLNSRFSGVWPDAFTSAEPLEVPAHIEKPITTKRDSRSKDSSSSSSSSLPPSSSSVNSATLHIVSSPTAARSLLLSHLTRSTPLMGHALENDLNATRLVHPTIVDTVLLFTHPMGLPRRYALRTLALQHLGREIQAGGGTGAGHDSKEDANVAGDLILLKVGEKWKRMKEEGWTSEKGILVPPGAGKKRKSGDGV